MWNIKYDGFYLIPCRGVAVEKWSDGFAIMVVKQQDFMFVQVSVIDDFSDIGLSWVKFEYIA